MKSKFTLLFFVLSGWLLVNSCVPDPVLDEAPSTPTLNGNFQWVDAQVKIPDETDYQFEGHELTTVGSQINVEADGRTKVPKRNDVVTIHMLSNSDAKPILLGYSTPENTDISPEATAKVVLFNLYRVATMPVEMQTAFFEAFDEDESARAYVAAFVEHWKSNPTTLASRSYLDIIKNYHGISKPIYQEFPANARVQNEGGRYYFVESEDTGETLAGYTLRIEDNKQFYLANNGPGRGTAFVYKMRRKGNTDVQFSELIQSFTPDTKSDRSWFINSAEYLPIRHILTGVVEDYRATNRNGSVKFKESLSGPHELPLGDDDVEVQYAIRIVDAGVNTKESELTNEEYRAYVKHVHASLIIDYYLPFLGVYMGLDIQDFYSMEGQDCVDRLDEAIRSVGLHTQFAEDIANGQLGRLLFLLESYFQSEETNFGWKLHEAVFGAVGKSTWLVSEGTAKRAGYLSYYFDNGIFWDAEDERVRFLQYYLDTHGLTTLEATARAGLVRISPRFLRTTSLAPNNRINLEASVQSPEFEDLDVTYHWSTAGKYGLVSGEKDKALYVAYENTELYGDVFESVRVEVRKDGQLVGRDSATVHISRSRYRMEPEHAKLTGDPEKGANVVTIRIKPQSPEALDIENDPVYDFRIDWSTEGIYGGIRWPGRYATYWTTESETYNDGSIQYYCQDDQIESATEIIRATIYAKPKGAPDHLYEFYDFLMGGIDVRNGEIGCGEVYEYFVPFEKHDGLSYDDFSEAYNVVSPAVSAVISVESCDESYELRKVYKDGTKGEWVKTSAKELRNRNSGKLIYREAIMPFGFFGALGVSHEKALEVMKTNKNLELLEDYPALGIDVKILR